MGSAEASLRTAPARIARHRRRTAALIGLLLFLGLAIATLTLLGLKGGSQPLVAVLRARDEIRPGTTIGAGELQVTEVFLQDPSVLATLAREGDRDRLVGQVAVQDVPAGALVPANVALPQGAAGMWKAAVPIKRMPADLHGGDHVAVLVEGLQNNRDVYLVVMQDVVVLHVGSGAVDLWLPAKAAPQIEWYADHGGLVLLSMPAGGVQSGLPAGGS